MDKQKDVQRGYLSETNIHLFLNRSKQVWREIQFCRWKWKPFLLVRHHHRAIETNSYISELISSLRSKLRASCWWCWQHKAQTPNSSCTVTVNTNIKKREANSVAISCYFKSFGFKRWGKKNFSLCWKLKLEQKIHKTQQTPEIITTGFGGDSCEAWLPYCMGRTPPETLRALFSCRHLYSVHFCEKYPWESPGLRKLNLGKCRSVTVTPFNKKKKNVISQGYCFFFCSYAINLSSSHWMGWKSPGW